MTIIRVNEPAKVSKKLCVTYGHSKPTFHRPSNFRPSFIVTTNHDTHRNSMYYPPNVITPQSSDGVLMNTTRLVRKSTSIVTPNKPRKLRRSYVSEAALADDSQRISEETVRTPLASLSNADDGNTSQNQYANGSNRVSIVGAPTFSVPIKFRELYERPPSPTSSMTMMEIDDIDTSSCTVKLELRDDHSKEVSEDQGKTEKPRPRVNFVDTVKVTEIPHRRMYTMEQHHQMYNNSMTIRSMAQRNLIEYNYEGRNWRLAVEEDSFVRSYYDGSLIHPAHVPVYHSSVMTKPYDCSVNC